MTYFSRSLALHQCYRTFVTGQSCKGFKNSSLSALGSTKCYHPLPVLGNGCYMAARHFQTKQSRNKEEEKKSFFQRVSKEMKVALGLGTVLASYLIYKDMTTTSRNDGYMIKNIALQRKGEPIFLPENPPEHAIARSIRNSKDASNLKLTLYQYQTCPFCCKLRAFLDYYGFSYDVVEVNSVTRRQTAWTSYKKVPFLLVELPGAEADDGCVMQLKDSSVIISALASTLRNPKESIVDILESYPSYYDEDNKLQFSNRFNVMYGNDSARLQKNQYEKIDAERVWRRWVDEVFVHTLSPNVYKTPSEALQAFRWFSEVGDWERLFPAWERILVVYVGAAVMWLIGKRLKKRYNLEDDPRLSLYQEATAWTKAIKASGGPFIGGKEPNLADISMYGVLTAIEGCDAFTDMMESTNIGYWFTEMKSRVVSRDGEHVLAKRCAIR